MTTQTASQPDNLLGICHALGETFGFNPIYLRLLFLVGIMLAPTVSLAAYATGGVAVLASKLLVRGGRRNRVSSPALINA